MLAACWLMSFFSKKTRGDNKITIFTALFKGACGFVSFDLFKIVSLIKKVHAYLVGAYSYRFFFALLLLSCIGVVGVKTAFSQVTLFDDALNVKSTLLIYPSSIANSSWSGNEDVLSPDLDEDAIYQKFNAKNSAYIPLDALIIDDVEIPVQQVPTDTSNETPVLPDDESSTTTSSETTDGSSSNVEEDQEEVTLPVEENTISPVTEELETGSSTETIVEEPASETEVPQEQVESVEPEVPSESPVPESSEPVTLKTATESFFTFFSSVTDLFPFRNTATVIDSQDSETTVPSETPTAIENVTEIETPDTESQVDLNNQEALTSENNLQESELIPSVDEASVQSVPAHFVIHTLSLQDFSTPELKPGEFITSMQLRMSLAALYENTGTTDLPTLEINYKTPSSTENIGSISIDSEVSNALNGGYFLFALPQVTDIAALKDVTIEVTYEGDLENLKGMYLDAVWLEVDVERIDKELLEAKTAADTQELLADPVLNTLLSEDVDFTREELPHFSLRYNSQRNVAVRFIRDLFGRTLAEVEQVTFVHNDVGDVGVIPNVSITEDGLLSITLNESDKQKLKPGEYSVELTINEGGVTYTDSFEFQWGLLSINSNQTSYKPNSVAHISMGSLSPNGNTVCDANLQLYIIDPSNAVSKALATPSGVCNGNNVVDVPDYSAEFIPSTEGEYEMYLERLDANGNVLSHTSDTFLVASVLPLSLERIGPSRIYPKATYPMEITVKGDNTWTGRLVEMVPASFVITDTDARVIAKGDMQELSWDIDLSSSSSQSVRYTFDAPDISPFLYMVGKARLEGKNVIPTSTVKIDLAPVESPTVGTTTEPIQKETQSTTSVESLPAVVPEVNTIPSTSEESESTNEQVPEANEESLFEKIIDILPFVGDETPTENETESSSENTNQSDTLAEPLPTEQVVGSTVTGATSTDAQAVGVQSSQTNIVFEEHRQWQIASDATGSMVVYWTSGASVPAGWTCLSCGSGTFYQKFVRGGATYNSTGGAATQTHNASGTVSAAALANSENRAGVNVILPSHAHTYTPTITASTTLPAYRNLRVIQNNSAGEPASLPAGVILLFDGTLPSGWARYAALDARYPRGENALASVGSSSHRHTISGSVDASTGSTVDGRAGGTQVTTAAENHTHTVTLNTGVVNHEPPYISVIFATSSGATNTPTSALAMWTDTPPAQWQNVSATTTDPFYDKFIKGSATYGTTGGSLSHTHTSVSGSSSAAVNTQGARTGATGSNSTHTHIVQVTNFTSASNLPPYLTAIFARKYGAVPLYTQTAFKWFANTNASTPTDLWPSGSEDLLQNEEIDTSHVPVKNGDVVRVRMQLSLSNSTSTADIFKLQYASTTGLCSAATIWADVGSATSSALWRGYDNAGVSDGATLSSSTLSGTDVFASYEERNPSVAMPNVVSTSQQAEWDFVLQQNNAYEGATYCFRMVKSTGATLYAYAQYPRLVTNEAPNPPTLSKLFDNEKVGTTTPDFEFFGVDQEQNDLTYQIQVDDDYAFTSTNLDRNSVSNASQFENLVTPADKDPFTQGETIRFNNITAFTDGVTYYWRVRAKDPTGSNTYGDWSTVYSFTVDTSITLSTWFQTTEEQFDTNSYIDTEAVPSDQVQLRTGSTTGTMYSEPITFSDAQVGTAWSSFFFSDTETSSDLKYTIQYNDNDVWTDVPDSALSGNIAGFDTSPVSIIDLDKEIYTELRVEANFVNSGASPSLQSWGISWGYRVETPDISAPFASEKVSTTTPTFEFTTTDPQGDSLMYEVLWSLTDTFTSSTTRTSASHAGFSNPNNGGDTSPFDSGGTIQFKIQPNDSLIDGATYWWKVRAKDPAGSNSYSFYSDPRSFTVDTSVTVSTWFQSTREQFNNDALSSIVTVATTSDQTLVAYAEGTATVPRYRTWSNNVWSAEANAQDVGAVMNWIVTDSSPVRNEYILATLGTDNDINVQIYNGSSSTWGNLQETTTGAASSTLRGVGVAYEQLSGDALVVSCDGDFDPNYYIWNGTNWTNGGSGIGLSAAVNCGYVQLISDPLSDEIVAITRNTTGTAYEVRVWNGSSWGNGAIWGSMAEPAHEGMAAAYEESGNQLVVAVSNGTNANFSWRTWDGSSWSSASTTSMGNDFEFGRLTADVGTDAMALCYVDEDSDVGALRWTGSKWVFFVELETTAKTKVDRPVDCAFETETARDGFIMVAYSDTTNTRYQYWNGTTWVAEASVSTIADAPTVQLRRNADGQIHLLSYDEGNDRYDYSTWRNAAWRTFQSLETNASAGAFPYKEPFMFAPRDSDIYTIFSKATSTATVATSTRNSLIAYAEGSVTTPRYRTWDGTVWSTEGSTLDVGAAINWVVTKPSPIESEYILATMGTDADVNVQVYRNGTWGDLQEVTNAIANTAMRGFDVAYEQLSGDAMVVTCDGDANPTYYIWNGTTWANSGGIGLSAGNTCGWIKLISDPLSDEIIAITRDTSGTAYEARVWNGTTWANSTTWGSMNQVSHEGIAAEYEESGNQAVVAVSNGTAASFTWLAWNGTTWSTPAVAQTNGDDFEAGNMVADVGSDNLALCYVDEDGDIGVQRWTGAAWVAFVAATNEQETAWTTASNIYNDRPVDCAFEVGGSRDGYIMVVYSDLTNMRYRYWNGANWVAEATVSTLNESPRVQVRRTADNIIQVLGFASTTDRYDYTYWNGTIWSALQTLESDASVGATPFKEPLMIAPESPSVTGTVVGDPLIDFYEGSGPYWQRLSWRDIEQGGSTILYQIEYYDGDTWELVPDSLISNNSTGNGTSPVDLSGVLPVSTYSQIRPVANFTCNAGTCPVLRDWTITWSGGITISGTAQQYNQSTNVTSGTVAVAINGTVQIGKTSAISAGTWSIANVNASVGDVITLFITGATDATEAIAVTKYDGVGDMSGVNLYERHLSIGSNDNATVSNANLGLYDFTNTEDVFFNVDASNDLTMCATTGCIDAELIIKAGNTFQSGTGGDITTHDFENNGTLKLNGNTMRVSGSWDNNATTTPATSTVFFNAATTTESINETGAISPSFNNITFGVSTSTATWNVATALDINGNLTVTGGTFDRGSLALTVAGNLTNATNGVWSGIGTTTFDGTVASTWSDASVALQNIGRVVIDGTNKSVTLGSNVKARSLKIGSDDTFDASPTGFNITVFTHWINNNTFNARTGTVIFAATTTNKIITAGGDNFYNLSFTGSGGAWSFTESTLGIDNDVSITAGTVTLPTATTTIAGSFTNSGTFVHNNGQLYFTSTAAETLTLAGTASTNAFYKARFNGSGSWTFTEANATTSNLFSITAGNVTLPSGTLTLGDTFTNTAGTFTHNNGTVKFTNTGTKIIDTNSSFYSLRFTGAGSNFSFLDSSVTALGNLTVSAGTLTLPSGTLTLGGSLTNSATLTHNNGTILFNSADTGETIDTGNSSLYNMTFNSSSGGWTISQHATTTNNTTLTAANSFTLASGKRLSVSGIFTNSVGGTATTWTGSTVSLESGAYTLNTKTNTGDAYNILLVKANTDIKMWNSSASTYTVDATGSLYSQDHAAVDGDLYIFGNYPRTSGTEYWSYATDFDGTALSTTSRQVDVKFASGASASFSGSTLNITGGSTATTTIANQGAGTYLIGVSSGTTTASYYSFANLGSTGLSLTASNKVTSLAYGVFSPGVGGGTTLTVSSTTIDRNPALQIYNVNFSTTSIIVATNVTQIDGTPSSYWWFRNSTGNLDGEAKDFDTGDPGSIRWDDSSLVFTVAGTVYSDDGTTPLIGGTCNGIATPVRVKVEGGTTYDGTCSAVNGSFNIPGVVAVGDPTITVFLNGASGGQKAVTVTKTPTQDISNLDLYANRVIVRHQDVAAMTIADMAPYDSTDDSDISFTAATGTSPLLTVAANTELFVWATTTFTPGGIVTLRSGGTGTTYDGSLHIDNGATFTGAGTTTYSIGGSYTQDLGATFTPASSTVLMLATTTGKTLSVATGATSTFSILRFMGVGGGWNLNGNMSSITNIEVATGTLTGTGNIAVQNGSLYGNGTLSLGGGTTTISKTNTLGGTRAWTFKNLVLGNGLVVGTTTPASTATTTISGKLTISTAHYLKANASRFNLSGTGNVFLETGTFLEGTSTVRYSGTGAANIISTPYYNLELKAGGGTPTYTATGLGVSVLNNLTIGGLVTTTANFDTSDPALDVNGNVTITSNGTLVGSNAASFTVGGSWSNAGTFTSSGGTVTFDGSGSPTIDAGSSTFGNLTINGTGSYIISQDATTTAAFGLTAATAFTLTSGKTLAVGGTFTNGVGGAATTWTGSVLRLYSGTNYQINAKTRNDVYATLSIAANTDIRMWNSSASVYSVDATGSLYSQDHSAVDGDVYIYGNYPGNGGTDYWSYATDFDGTNISTTSRQVDVRFQSGASMTLLNGGLRVLGSASASTSLQNQGSGTYGISIGGSASTTWEYYDVQHTDSSGLTFSGAPNVVSLSRGSFTVTQPGGSAITVGGTVINANTARTFTNNIFATTTSIAAFNVTATGTAVSSWRFTNHSGNIAGELKDSDPDGDPGYIVWDNSAASVTISGHIYSDEGSTVSTMCDSFTPRIHLRIAGLTSYTTSCNGNGAGGGTGLYSISGITFSPGDSLVVYIDGGSAKGAVVSEDLLSSVSNMDIYENRVIVRHESTDPLSIADMSLWDSGDDVDIPFTAVDSSPDTLTLPANRKLLVWTGKQFAPGGNVTLSGGGGGAAYDGTLEAQTNSTVTFVGTEQHSIGGSFIFGTGATFTAGLSTTTFTTTGSARTIDVNNQSFYKTAFTGAGSWTVTDSILTLHSAYITAGTLTLPTGTTTVSGTWSNNGGAFMVNGSKMLFTSTASGNVVRGGGSNFAEMLFRGTGGSWSMTDTNATTTSAFTIASGTVSLPSGLFSVGGSFRNNGGTITHNTAELILRSTTAATLKTRGSSLFALTVNAAGPFTMSDGSLTLVDDFRMLRGAITLSTSTLSVGGSFLVTGTSTFTHASGTVLFNATATGKTINPRLSSFYNVVFGSGTGGWTISASATTTRNFTLTTASSFTMATATRLYVGNVFTNSVGGSATTWTGSTLVLNSGSTYAMNTKSAGGDHYQNLRIGANTDISMWNSRATSTTVDSSGSLYSQDHAASDGALNIYGDYHISTSTAYWSYATDFDGTVLGGSSRDVTVSIAPNATTTVDGGALSMLGTSGHLTTVQVLGSGSYAFSVTSGSLNALYYRYRNLNSTGLSMAGSPTIYSLSQGDFLLAVNGGTLITLSSTTLNSNASLLVTGNVFATSTAITGKNVTLTGTTTNAWTFVSHTGNLDGESFDVDGVTLCGSIRWSDSACLLTQQTHYRWRNDDGAIGVPNTEWYNSNWDARQRVRIQNVDAGAYTNAVVKVHVTFDSDMQTDFDDLRFTTAGGTTTLKFFTERYTASTDADVWVKIPTLAADDTTTIFMYYKNATASSTSSSTQTFVVADDFEDGNKTEYSGDTTLFTVDGSFAYGGSYGLDTTGSENSRATDGIARFTNSTVSQGQIIRYMQYVDTASGSGDEVCTLFGVQSPVTTNNNYAVCLEQVTGTDRISLVRDVDDVDTSAGSTMISSTTVAYTTGWYEVEVDWESGGDMFVTLTKDDVLIATTSGNSNTYTTGGIGFTYWYQHGGWDNYTSRARVDTEPTVRFGAEQTDGGASWKAALDTAASYILGDIARIRFAVENTGLQITNQTYDIEFAAQGAAPSCEAVSSGSYVHVPNQASCGSSALCMQSSANITDNGSATDLLFGPEIDFTTGKVVESPSYTTSPLTLNQNVYTEIEYAITPTVNAILPSYCLRVTNAGTPVDTYLQVAKLNMRFDPDVTGVSLNGGSDITLVPGATTTISVSGTATDLNGSSDLNNATSTIYRSGVAGGAACTANNNSCYISSGARCSFSSCAGNSCTVSCTADIYFHADATDVTGTYPGENWLGSIEVSDQSDAIDIGTVPVGVELVTLQALDVTSGAISYGSLAVSSTTGSFNPTTTVQNLGNVPIDVNVEGTDLSDGGSSKIPSWEQRYSTTTFTYSGCPSCSLLSSTTPAHLEVDLSKPTTNVSPVTDIVYWGIAIPFGTASNPHSGTNIFYAITD